MLARPALVGRLAALDLVPVVAVVDDEALLVEAEKRDAGNGLDLARPSRDRSPPLDCGAVTVDEWLAEPALGRGLLRERPGDVLADALPRSIRMGEEDGTGRVQRRDCVDICRGPCLRPDVGPASGCLSRVYFATSMARLSRITMTLTWPGYSS